VAPTGSSVRAAVDAFLSSHRCANRHTRQAYTNVLDRSPTRSAPIASWPGAASTAGLRPLPEAVERRPETAEETRAVDRRAIERLPTRRDIPLREKTLWRMLYETAARAAEILALNIEDLDLEGRRGKVVSKGGDVEYVMWSSGTAHLLPRLIRGRTRGPVSLCRRRPVLARRPPARDICPDTGRARLGYDRARVLLDRYTSSG
jgi:integrase